MDAWLVRQWHLKWMDGGYRADRKMNGCLDRCIFKQMKDNMVVVVKGQNLEHVTHKVSYIDCLLNNTFP